MTITFVGGGNMAQAIIGGLAQRGLSASDLQVVEIAAAARARLERQFGVRVFAEPAAAAPFGDLLVMAVKPQQMRAAAAALRPHLGGELVLSIAAGIRLADLSRWLGGHALLARCMPNTPALVGEGVSGLYCPPQAPPAARAAARAVLEAVGAVIELQSESLLDPVTAVSGSGPAYVFLFMEAMERAARELGLSAAQAKTLALGTFCGAAKLAAASPEDVSVLRARVTSKGGTTESALASMATGGVVEAIVRAIHAANRRAIELGEELGRDS